MFTELMPIFLQVKFHFTTKVVDGDGGGNIIDDSRKFTQPMELLIGKQFKLEVWESIIKTMAVKEVAEFHVHSSVSIKHICLNNIFNNTPHTFSFV